MPTSLPSHDLEHASGGAVIQGGRFTDTLAPYSFNVFSSVDPVP